MADLTKTTKVVEYVLQGNTVDLEKTLKNAIDQLNVLEQRMQQVASAPMGKRKNSIGRAADIASASNRIGTLQQQLQQPFEAVTPAQLNVLNQASIALDKLSLKLQTAAAKGKVTNKMLDGMRKQLQEISKSVKDAGLQVTKAADPNLWKQFTDSITTNLKSLTFWVQTIRRVINALIDGYESAIAFVETINLFNVAVKDSAESLSEFANNLTQAFSADPLVIYKSIAIFRQYANTMKFTSAQADVLSENLTKLTLDLASLYNTTNETMLSALQSGLAGLTKPLMRYGISVHKATLEQTALALGVEKTWAEFTEAEKVALRYIAILDQTSGAQGDLARTLESPENQLKITKQQLTLLTRNLGSFVTIIAQRVLPALNTFLTGINDLLAGLASLAGYTIPDYSDNLSENNQMFSDGTEDIEEYEAALKSALAPLDEINQVTPGQDAVGFGIIDPNIANALKGYDNLIEQLSTKFQWLGDIIATVKNIVLDFLSPLSLIGSVFANIWAIISPILVGVFEGLNNILTAIQWVTSWLSLAFGWIGQVVGALAPMIDQSSVLQEILGWIGTILSGIVAIALTKWVVAAAKGFATWAVSIWNATVALIKNTVAMVVNTAKIIANTIATWWNNAALIGKIGLLTLGAGLLIVPIVLAAVTNVQNKASQVPAMATGGVIDSPTLAMVGEGRYHEAVVPLGRSPQFRTMKEDIAAEVLRNFTQPPSSTVQPRASGQPIILQVNGREFARAILPDLGYTQPQTGVKIR